MEKETKRKTEKEKIYRFWSYDSQGIPKGGGAPIRLLPPP